MKLNKPNLIIKKTMGHRTINGAVCDRPLFLDSQKNLHKQRQPQHKCCGFFLGLVVVSVMILVAGVLIIILQSASAFQGTSASYTMDSKPDTFAHTNASSTSFIQRVIGGIQAVSQYVSSLFTGRFGILDVEKNLAINITYPIHNSNIIRGSISVAGEDDKNVIADAINLSAKVYENGTTTGFSSATCYFYDNSALVGSSATNSSGDCILNYTKTSLSAGQRSLYVNYSISTSDTMVINDSQINFSIIRYVTLLSMENTRTGSVYYDGDNATLSLTISKINASGTFAYDPQNITANATNSAETIYANGKKYYPGGNISRSATGQYYTNITVLYSFGTFLRWDVWLSDDNYVSYIGSAVHADKSICAADFGDWGNWSACAGGSKTRTRTDSSACSEVETSTEGCGGDDGGCFLAGTKILMSDKTEKNIEDIKINDLVLSYDTLSKKNKASKVVQTFVHDSAGYLLINDELKVTANHPVFINNVWEEIGLAKVGDKLQNNDKENVEINSIKEINESNKVYNLEVDETHNYYAQEFLVHNKGETCTPTWTAWSEWSACSGSPLTKTRTRNDGCGNTETETSTTGCGVVPEICTGGIDEDGDGSVDCADSDCTGNPACACTPNWQCSWTGCELANDGKYYSNPYGCVDSRNCNLETGRPDRRICIYDEDEQEYTTGTCLSVFDCTSWTECKADYDLNMVIHGEASLGGQQSRLCKDLRGCENQTIQWQNCSMALTIKAEKTSWCFEPYVEIYDIDTNKLISRIKESVIQQSPSQRIKTLDIGFIVSNFSGYCSYCYDGVKNYDESDIDCGGSGCTKCVLRGKYFDWLIYVKWFLWILILILIIYLVYKNREKIAELFKREFNSLRNRT